MASTFNIIDWNIVAFTGLIYFLFNSVVSATSAFGFIVFTPVGNQGSTVTAFTVIQG